MIPSYLFDIIKKFEGLRLESYQDTVGIWTIGYGTTGPFVHANQKISQNQAETFLQHAVQTLWDEISQHASRPLKANEQAAMTSFAYNLGLSALLNSTLWKLAMQNSPKAANEFPRWVHAGGVVLPGLVARRNAEMQMYKGINIENN